MNFLKVILILSEIEKIFTWPVLGETLCILGITSEILFNNRLSLARFQKV